MALVPALGALLLAACTLAAIGFALWRRRARRRLGERAGVEASFEAASDDFPEVDYDEHAPSISHTDMNDASHAYHDDELDAAYAVPLTQRRSEPSVHDKATRAFAVADDPQPARSLHETPTREFAAHPESNDEVTAQGPSDLASRAQSGFGFDDDGENTCVYQPDAEMLDSLRGLAASTSPVRTPAREEPRAPVTTRPPAPAALSFGLPPPSPQMAERVRSLPPLSRGRSESFYIQSNVQSEERVAPRRLPSRAPAPANDVRTSGFAPTSAPKTGTRAPEGQAPRARTTGQK
jgi:hypothetical protein